MNIFRKRSGGTALAARVREVFGLEALCRPDEAARRAVAAWQGRPDWLDGDEGIGTVNFAGAICAELARLTCLGVKLTLSGSERADWLQGEADRLWPRLRQYVEAACAWGAVALKPSGEGVDMVTPDRFVITQLSGGDVTGAVFASQVYDPDRERWYTRLESHRFLPDGRYVVVNRCFEGDSPSDRGRAVAIEATPWAGLCEQVLADGLERPLFALLRAPGGEGPLGRSVFAGAMEELRDLDVAYSRMTAEIADSRRISLIDDRLTDCPGREKVRLPRFVRRVFAMGPQEYYQEIDPALHTAQRLVGLNALLGQIGFKCGFSNGYFVFNERSGLVTATQVEADERRTVQLVKDVRDAVEAALDGLFYALDAAADAMDLAPAGIWEAVYDFGDVTYNREEDRSRWYGYVADGRMPFWYYLVKFEGYSEQEARALAKEAGA